MATFCAVLWCVWTAFCGVCDLIYGWEGVELSPPAVNLHVHLPPSPRRIRVSKRHGHKSRS